MLFAQIGEQWTKDTEDMLETVIDLCIDNEMIAVVEVHDATGKDDKIGA